jgi:RecB family exonuclease
VITIRQSMLNDYERCPHMCLKLWGRYGEPDPPFRDSEEVTNKYAMCGTALHEVMDDWAKVTKGGRRYPLAVAHEKLNEKLQAIPLEQFESPEDKAEWVVKMNEQLDWIWSIYCTHPPLFSELNFHLEDLIPGLPPVEGTIDRIDGNFATRSIDLIDYKTGKQYTKKELLSNMQATLYVLAFERLFSFRPEKFIFIFSKTRREKVITITQDFIDRGLERIKGIWYKIEQNDFAIPKKTNKYFCEHFCTQRSTCPKWNKRKPQGWEGVDRI